MVLIVWCVKCSTFGDTDSIRAKDVDGTDMDSGDNVEGYSRGIEQVRPAQAGPAASKTGGKWQALSICLRSVTTLRTPVQLHQT